MFYPQVRPTRSDVGHLFARILVYISSHQVKCYTNTLFPVQAFINQRALNSCYEAPHVHTTSGSVDLKYLNPRTAKGGGVVATPL